MMNMPGVNSTFSIQRSAFSSSSRIAAYLFAPVIVIALLTGCGPSRLELGTEQGRLDEAAPVIEGTTTAGQTFVSHHDRLAAVEVLLVVYGEAGAPDGKLTFHLRTTPTNTHDLAVQTFQTDELTHNQLLRISFDPLPGSRDQSYYFFFEGTAGSQVTLWYNTLDAYGEGAAFFNEEPQAGDLQFKTFYDYTLGMMAQDVLQGTARYGWLTLPLIVLLLVPGYLALLLVVPAGDWPVPTLQIPLAAGLSGAILPLGLLFATLLGLSLTPLLFGASLGLLALAALWRLWTLNWQPLAAWRDRSNWPALAVFGGLLAVTLGVRMLQIRELVVPAWVDGVHHTMMAQLIAEQGRVPANYQPHLDIGPFIYHFGFHALAAELAWLTGISVSQAVLVMGQVLNALVGAGVYGLTVTLMCRQADEQADTETQAIASGHSSPPSNHPLSHPASPSLCTAAQKAGLVAMGIVGTVSLMPAYYVTWGRYTQLTGLVVLPAAAMLTLWWVEDENRWALILGSLAIAGLGLVHYRVLVFYGAFVLALLMYKAAAGHLVRVGVLAGISLLLLTPWIARLAAALVPTGRGAGWFQGPAAFNAVPRSLIDVGYDRILLRLALLSLLLGIVWWRRVSILLSSWAAGAILAANPNLLGLRETWLLNNAALVITLFLPMGILTGVLAGVVADAVLKQLVGRWRLAIAWIMVGLLFVGVLAGAWNMLDIVNPVTIIATKDDIAAMEWIRENTPPDAGFVTNVRIWQFKTYMGADGGYWIPLLTGRRTLVPPAIYSSGSPEYYRRVQETLETLAGISKAQDPKLTELMSRHDLEYVYFGAKGGHLDLKSFVTAPNYNVVYSNGPVWIFQASNVEYTAHLSREVIRRKH